MTNNQAAAVAEVLRLIKDYYIFMLGPSVDKLSPILSSNERVIVLTYSDSNGVISTAWFGIADPCIASIYDNGNFTGKVTKGGIVMHYDLCVAIDYHQLVEKQYMLGRRCG